MSFKKRAIKSIVLVLVGVSVITTSILKVVSVIAIEKKSNNINLSQEFLNLDINNIIENEEELIKSHGLNKNQVIQLNEERKLFDVETKLSDMFSDKQIKLLKLEFNSVYGDEDVYKKVNKENNVLTEVNGHRGIIKTTICDNNGTIKDIVEINYFESIENLNQEGKEIKEIKEINDRAMFRSITVVPSKQFGSGTVASVFYPYIKVTRDKRDRINIHGIKSGQKKSYSKDKYNWNSGNTLNFYNSISNASNHFNNIAYKLSGVVLSKYISYVSGLISTTSVVPTLAAVTSILAVLGITVNIFDVAKETVEFIYDFIQINKYYHKI